MLLIVVFQNLIYKVNIKTNSIKYINMKILFVLISLISVGFCQKKYTLTIYKSIDCNYCKFAANQINSLVKQYQWENMLDVIIVDCQKAINLCRDSQSKPLLVMKNQKDQKLGQIGGVRSKLFFRDWISEFVTKNPIQTQQIKKDNDKYKRIVVKNKLQVSQFYDLYSESKKNIKKNKLDIIKQANKIKQVKKNMKQFDAENKKIKQQMKTIQNQESDQDQEINQKKTRKNNQKLTQQNSIKSEKSQQVDKQNPSQQQQQDEEQSENNLIINLTSLIQQFLNFKIFRDQIIGLIMIVTCLCLCVICIMVKRTSSRDRVNRSFRVPVEQDEPFR